MVTDFNNLEEAILSVFSEFKSMYKSGKDFVKDDFPINKLARILRNISAILVLILLFVHYWDFMKQYHIGSIPLFEDGVRNALHKYTFVLIIAGIVFDVLSTPLLTPIIIYLDSKCKIKLLPIWNTIEDLLEICVAAMMVLFSVNCWIEFYHGYNILIAENQKVYGIIVLYFMLGCINWIYAKNRTWWYYQEKTYTNYFDINGNRIAEDDRVIYYRKLYKIERVSHNEGDNSVNSKNKLCLVENTFGIITHNILLEEAVKDENGGIRVYKFGMGEKGRTNKL